MARFDLVSYIYDYLPIPTHPTALRDRIEGIEGPTMDLGGGTGRFTVKMHPGDQRPLVLDASHGMLARARRSGRRLDPIQGVGQAMPLADRTLGAITITEAFHHFAPDQQAVVEEAARVLREDGVLVIEEIDPTRWGGRAVELGEHLIGFGSVFLPPQDLEEMARAAFAEVEIERSGSFTYVLEARDPDPTPP